MAFVMFVLLVVAVPAAVALLLVNWRHRRPRSGVSRATRWLGSAVSIAVLLFVAFAVVGVLAGDAVDDLDSGIRSRVRGGIDGGLGCSHDFSFARISRAEVLDGGATIKWTCEWTILGWPSFDGESHCADRRWLVSGWNDLRELGDC